MFSSTNSQFSTDIQLGVQQFSPSHNLELAQTPQGKGAVPKRLPSFFRCHLQVVRPHTYVQFAYKLGFW